VGGAARHAGVFFFEMWAPSTTSRAAPTAATACATLHAATTHSTDSAWVGGAACCVRGGPSCRGPHTTRRAAPTAICVSMQQVVANMCSKEAMGAVHGNWLKVAVCVFWPKVAVCLSRCWWLCRCLRPALSRASSTHPLKHFDNLNAHVGGGSASCCAGPGWVLLVEACSVMMAATRVSTC
jgi:hypothetical protein